MFEWWSWDAWLPRLLERGAERYSRMRASDIVVEGCEVVGLCNVRECSRDEWKLEACLICLRIDDLGGGIGVMLLYLDCMFCG